MTNSPDCCACVAPDCIIKDIAKPITAAKLAPIEAGVGPLVAARQVQGGGDAARAVLPDAVRRSHDRLCTVSRTIELGIPVTSRVQAR